MRLKAIIMYCISPCVHPCGDPWNGSCNDSLSWTTRKKTVTTNKAAPLQPTPQPQGLCICASTRLGYLGTERSGFTALKYRQQKKLLQGSCMHLWVCVCVSSSSSMVAVMFWKGCHVMSNTGRTRQAASMQGPVVLNSKENPGKKETKQKYVILSRFLGLSVPFALLSFSLSHKKAHLAHALTWSWRSVQ